MNKIDFLDELRKHLVVLENHEQQDILDEYSQHIDMKIERGLSEEEAINDFGCIGELAAQILEAYHVNPEYEKAGEEKKKIPDLTALANTGKKAGGSIGHTMCRFGAFFIKNMVKGIKSGAAFFKKVWSAITRPFYGGKDRIRNSNTASIKKEPRQHRTLSDTPSLPGRAIGSIGHILSRCCSAIWALSLWGIRWCWNGAVIFICLFSGTAVLFSVFSFAVLIVWLLQGYPIAGITLICLGVILGSVSFTVLCLSFLRLNHYKKTASPVVRELSEEDEHA